MTKLEKIAEEYGEHWEAVKNEMTENYFVPYRLVKNSKAITFDFKELHIVYGSPEIYVRPQSLAGIENNNGWIKIESEDDLPKLTINYHVLKNGTLTEVLYAGKNRWFVNGRNYPLTTEIAEITHYQPIIKPQPPIY